MSTKPGDAFLTSHRQRDEPASPAALRNMLAHIGRQTGLAMPDNNTSPGPGGTSPREPFACMSSEPVLAGNVIRRQRLALGLTRHQLAKASGASWQTLQLVEEIAPEREPLAQPPAASLAQALGLRPSRCALRPTREALEANLSGCRDHRSWPSPRIPTD